MTLNSADTNPRGGKSMFTSIHVLGSEECINRDVIVGVRVLVRRNTLNVLLPINFRIRTDVIALITRKHAT